MEKEILGTLLRLESILDARSSVFFRSQAINQYFRQSALLSFTPLGATPTKSQPAPLTHEFGRRDSKQAGAAAVMLLHPEVPSGALGHLPSGHGPS